MTGYTMLSAVTFLGNADPTLTRRKREHKVRPEPSYAMNAIDT